MSDLSIRGTKSLVNADSGAGSAHLYLREEQIRLACEALLLCWRDMQLVCEGALRDVQLGPAHHRILFLIATHEGTTMTELLRRLGITKQSLGRALGELVERGYVERHAGRGDRRRKPLTLTEKGASFERHLFDLQRVRFTAAYRSAGGMAVEGFRRVLSGLCGETGEGVT